MSNFACEYCGAICKDIDRGYISGCEHYPPDVKPLRGFGFALDIKTGVSRKWYMDAYGQRRWLHNDGMVEL
jgi:hypothetical protein